MIKLEFTRYATTGNSTIDESEPNVLTKIIGAACIPAGSLVTRTYRVGDTISDSDVDKLCKNSLYEILVQLYR